MQFINNAESLTYSQLNDKFLKLKSTVKSLKQAVLSQVYRANQKNNPALLDDLGFKAVWVEVEELRIKWFVVFLVNGDSLDPNSCLGWTVLSTYNLDQNTRSAENISAVDQFSNAFLNLEKTISELVKNNLVQPAPELEAA